MEGRKMTLSFPMFSLFNLIQSLRKSANSQTSPGLKKMRENNGVRADRAFLHELMCHYPEGIQSEHGFMAMMTHFPRKF